MPTLPIETYAGPAVGPASHTIQEPRADPPAAGPSGLDVAPAARRGAAGNINPLTGTQTTDGPIMGARTGSDVYTCGGSRRRRLSGSCSGKNWRTCKNSQHHNMFELHAYLPTYGRSKIRTVLRSTFQVSSKMPEIFYSHNRFIIKLPANVILAVLQSYFICANWHLCRYK